MVVNGLNIISDALKALGGGETVGEGLRGRHLYTLNYVVLWFQDELTDWRSSALSTLLYAQVLSDFCTG